MSALPEVALYARKPAPAPDPAKLVQDHLGLVRKIAWHVHGKVSTAIEIADLVQIGMIALLEAARQFEERGQAAFATYATLRIRGAMIDQLRRHATMCRGAIHRRRKIGEARAAVEAETGRAAEAAEIAGKLGMTIEAYHAAVDSSRGVTYESIDAVYSDHSEWFAADEEDSHAQLERADLSRALVAGLKSLPEREAMVLQLYYVEELNLEEIGAVLGVGAARICQIKKAALDRLRGNLSGWDEEA